MKRISAVTVSCMIFLMLVAACDNSNNSSNADNIEPAMTTTDPTAIIAESKVDFDGEGGEEKLFVRMVKGELKRESEPGPFAVQYWEGDFRLELHAEDGSLLHALDLNPTFGGESLRFGENRSFDIAFEDYNGDSYPDFSIGQYFSSNGSTYNLYSLMPEGIVLIHQDLLTADSAHSIVYEKAGNTSFKNRYYDMEQGEYVETLFTWQGDRFVRTQCEGCGMTESEPAGGELGGLNLTFEKTDDGFRLIHDESNGAYVSQTLISPSIEGHQYVVHLVRRNTEGEELVYRKDAVVVNPAAQQFQVYPLMEAKMNDMYATDSVTDAYGFNDAGRLVFVSVASDEKRQNGHYYRVESLNILTGETNIIVPEIPDAETDQRFARNWLSADGDTLVLNGSQSGKLWAIDTNTGKIAASGNTFVHYWPFYMTVPSPDGEQFWYADQSHMKYRLSDNRGDTIGEFPFSPGYDQYPAFQWSPDGRYAVYHDTRDQNEKHIIDNRGEIYVTAAQRVHFYDRQGKKVRTIQTDKESDAYVEAAGWLDGSQAAVLMHEYALDRTQASQPAKIKSRYYLLDLQTGKERALQIETDLARMKGASPARSTRIGSIYWVDANDGYVSISTQTGKWLTEENQQSQAWITLLYEKGVSSFNVKNSETGETALKEINHLFNENLLFGREWLVGDDMQYIQLKESDWQ